MAVLLVVLLTCLALPVQSQDCGKFSCLPHLGGTCENKRCKCPGNEVGDASIACENPDRGCLCIIKGDPHVDGFDGSLFTLPLPCAHRIVKYATSQSVSGVVCDVVIEGVAAYGEKTNNPLAAWEDRVIVKVAARSFPLEYQIQFNRNQDPVIGLETFPGMVIRNFAGDVKIITISLCGVRIKYDTKMARFSLSTRLQPLRHDSGLCGRCDVGQVNQSKIDPFQGLSIQLQNLQSTSVILGEALNTYPACDDITQTASSCSSEAAHKVCGSLFLRPNLRKCLSQQDPNPVELLNNFRDCYRDTCAVGLRPCADFDQYFKGCDTSEVVELSDPTICS